MSNDLTWVIDFRISPDKFVYDQILSKDWCKINKIEELIEGDFTEEKIIEYFNSYAYRQHLKDFWNDSVVINPKRLNIVWITSRLLFTTGYLSTGRIENHPVKILVGISPYLSTNQTQVVNR